MVGGEFEEEEELDPRTTLAGFCDDARASCQELPDVIICCEVLGVQEPVTLQVQREIQQLAAT